MLGKNKAKRIFVSPNDLAKAALYIRRHYGDVVITVRPCDDSISLTWQSAS